MPSNSFDRLLRALYRRRPQDLEASAAAREASAGRAMAAFDERYPAGVVGGGFRTPTLLRQIAIAAAVLLILSIGACQVPVDVQMNLGQRMHFVLPATPELRDRVHELVDTVRGLAEAEKVEVRVVDDGGETLRLTLGVWGERVDPQVVFEGVIEAYPELEILEREAAPMEATVRTTLGDKLRHELFARALNEHSVEEARAVILEELAREGFVGAAQVLVEDGGDGKRRVEIKLAGPGEEDIAELELDRDGAPALEVHGSDGASQELVEEVIEEVVRESGGRIEREVRVKRHARRVHD